MDGVELPGASVAVGVAQIANPAIDLAVAVGKLALEALVRRQGEQRLKFAPQRGHVAGLEDDDIGPVVGVAGSKEAATGIQGVHGEAQTQLREFLVQTRRQLDDATLAKVSDGRVFTGRQGLVLKLVDELGGEKAAVAWLAKEKNIDPKTPVRDFRMRDRFGDLPFLHTAAVAVLDGVGLGFFARRLEVWGAVQAMERLNLDGLLALWHPPANN